MHFSWKRPSIPEKYQSWLKENWWWLQLAALFMTALIITIAFRRGKWLNWVGFRGKTVWDWLDLLGVPLSLAILGYILQQQERDRAEAMSRDERRRAENLSIVQKERDEGIAILQLMIASNEAKEESLQVYFDRLSTLLIEKNILAIAVKVHPPQDKQGDDQPETTVTPEERELFDSAVDVIRARTLSILRRLKGDGEKKTSVIRFLLEAEIINKTKLSLNGADLSEADLYETNLSGADLSGADLSEADLICTQLIGTNFRGAKLREAELASAQLIGTNLGSADLRGAHLMYANLCGAHLSIANLSGANLSEANLCGAYLSSANLTEANLEEIEWDNETQWPVPPEVDKAMNIPEALKQQLGLTDTPQPPDADP